MFSIIFRTDYITWNGPNPDLRKGANTSLAKVGFNFPDIDYDAMGLYVQMILTFVRQQ